MTPRALALAVPLALAAAAAPAADCAHGEVRREVVPEFHRQYLAYRARSGLSALALSDQLTGVAEDYGCLMAEHGHFDHTGPDGSDPGSRAAAAGYAFCLIAENLALNPDTPVKALRGWIVSPGHRANLRLAEATEYGLALVVASRPREVPMTAPKLFWEVKKGGGLADVLGDYGAMNRGSETTFVPPAAITGDRYWVMVLGRAGC
jgi:hypothetical protein